MSANNDDQQYEKCSFCGRTANQVRRLLSGPSNLFICDQCVDVCQQILFEEGLTTHTSEEKTTDSENELSEECAMCGINKEDAEIFIFDDYSELYYCGECLDRLNTIYIHNLKKKNNGQKSLKIAKDFLDTVQMDTVDDDSPRANQMVEETVELPEDIDALLNLLNS